VHASASFTAYNLHPFCYCGVTTIQYLTALFSSQIIPNGARHGKPSKVSHNKRSIYDTEHQHLRDGLQRFLNENAAPQLAQWEAQGHADKSIWKQLGELGAMSAMIPSEYGGSAGDMRMASVIYEEIGRCGVAGVGGIGVHDIVAYYLQRHGSDQLKNTWLPKAVSGDALFAVAMTEPGAGSDLRGIKTRAELIGDHYLLNGSKIFITNGMTADAIAVVCRTDPKAPRGALSILLVDTTSPGFTRGRKLEKIGQKSQDIAELFFEDVKVPASNLIGIEGRGLNLLMSELPFERLLIGLMALGAAKAAYTHTMEYVENRTAFGKNIAEFQNTRYALAEMRTDIEVGEAFTDRCVAAQMDNTLTTEQASMCKLWLTEMQDRVVDRCVQLHGGNGYMWEYPVAKLYADSRVQRIYGGTSEIMKELISRSPHLDS